MLWFPAFKTRSEIGSLLSLPQSLSGKLWKCIHKPECPLACWRTALSSLYQWFWYTTGSLAAYPLGKGNPKGFIWCFIFFLSGLMIPFQRGFPCFSDCAGRWLLMNSLGALILRYRRKSDAHNNMVFSAYVKSIPRELEEAQRPDGCGRTECLYAHRFETGGDYYCYYKYPFPYGMIFNSAVYFQWKQKDSCWLQFLYSFLWKQRMGGGLWFYFAVSVTHYMVFPILHCFVFSGAVL